MKDSKRRVLIIDDEEDLLAMLTLRLEASGRFEVLTARDGQTGLERTPAFKPDVVLVDAAMPGLDGWEVCRRLRDTPEGRAAALVMMTAGSPHGAERRARDTGVDALVLKPYESDVLLETLGQVRPPRSREETC